MFQALNHQIAVLITVRDKIPVGTVSFVVIAEKREYFNFGSGTAN